MQDYWTQRQQQGYGGFGGIIWNKAPVDARLSA
jgi:hypothetical protein